MAMYIHLGQHHVHKVQDSVLPKTQEQLGTRSIGTQVEDKSTQERRGTHKKGLARNTRNRRCEIQQDTDK